MGRIHRRRRRICVDAAGLVTHREEQSSEDGKRGNDPDDEQRELPPLIPAPYSVPARADAMGQSMCFYGHDKCTKFVRIANSVSR